MTRKAYPGPIWTAGDDYPVDCLLSEALHWAIFGRQDASADNQDIDLYEREEQKLSANIRSKKFQLKGQEYPSGPYEDIPEKDLVIPFFDWAGSKVWRSNTPPDNKVWLNVRIRTDDLLSIAPDPFKEETDEPPRSVQDEARQPDGEQPDAKQKGYSGRPSQMRAINAEMHRRAKAGETEPSLAAEARALHQWTITAYPGVQIPQPRSIENGIRKAFRKLKNPI